MRVHTDWLLTAQRAAIHLPTATAVIADLHLGYDQARWAGGETLPAFGIAEVIAALVRLVKTGLVHRLVVAGDLCEDGRYPESVADLVGWLKEEGIELAGVVPGNHDRGLAKSSFSHLLVGDGLMLGQWQVLHGQAKLPRHPVIHGHVHPCLRWRGMDSAPCFLVSARRIVIPAFSQDAAGASVLHDARWRGFRCYVPAGERVLDFGLVGSIQESLGIRRKKKPTRGARVGDDRS